MVGFDNMAFGCPLPAIPHFWREQTSFKSRGVCDKRLWVPERKGVVFNYPSILLQL